MRLGAGLGALAISGGVTAKAHALGLTTLPIPFVERPLDCNWRFFLGDPPGAATASFDDTGWRTLDVPHDYQREDLQASDTSSAPTSGPELWTVPKGPSEIGPFLATVTPDPGTPLGTVQFNTPELFERYIAWTVPKVAWYRKHLETPDIPPNGKVEVRFDGVYQAADIYINGFHLGFHPYGYTAFTFDLTPHLRSNGNDVLAVRINPLGYTSRWYPGAGIYRHVWLSVTGPASIPFSGLHITTPTVRSDAAAVLVRARVDTRVALKNVEATAVVFDQAGRPIASASAVEDIIPGTTTFFEIPVTVRNPALWSVETPDLYFVEVLLKHGGSELHARGSTFGIRTITIDVANGLQLNGKTVKLIGGCAHSSNGFLGSAAIDRDEYRKVELLKAAGFNAVRTSHNPPSTEFLDACDRLGLLVYEEAFDTWDLSKTPQDYSLYFKQYGLKDCQAMVTRDRNHPSVALWSIGNEIADINTETGLIYGEQLYNVVHDADPTRKITSGGMADNGLTGPQWSYLDLGDFHYDNTIYPTAHQMYPNLPLISTESYPYDLYNSWNAVLTYPYVIGDFVWTALDYFGESGIGHTGLAPDGSPPVQPISFSGNTFYGYDESFPWFISGCGDIDAIGQRRPQSFFRAVVLGSSDLEFFVQRPTPVGQVQQYSVWGWYDELSSWTWPGYEGQSMIVDVYTSCDQVDLELNGVVVDTQMVPDNAQLRAQFKVPYAAGNLVAVGYRDNAVVARRTLATVGSPHALRLVADRQTITNSRNDLSYVTVEVVDVSGAVVPDAVVNVSFAVSGSGELAAVGSGNPHNMASLTTPQHYTFHGLALAILRPSGGPGTINLTASADGLVSGRISVITV